ncbi:hypothetical protein SDC9_61297 [bioreactor metagenome]|uniref:Uncharacterized protein n=1 Tax=bioreactor metagenome TaxID=1076179 RepID=A0A644XL24_9ZZZZ
MVTLVGGGEAGVFILVGIPIELARIHDGTAHGQGVPVHVLGGGVDDNVSPPLKRAAVDGSGKRVIDDEWHAVSVGGGCKPFNVQHGKGRVCNRLPEHRLCVGPESGLKLLIGALGIHKGKFNAHTAHGDCEKIVGAAINAGGGHHMVTGRADVENGEE